MFGFVPPLISTYIASTWTSSRQFVGNPFANLIVPWSANAENIKGFDDNATFYDPSVPPTVLDKK